MLFQWWPELKHRWRTQTQKQLNKNHSFIKLTQLGIVMSLQKKIKQIFTEADPRMWLGKRQLKILPQVMFRCTGDYRDATTLRRPIVFITRLEDNKSNLNHTPLFIIICNPRIKHLSSGSRKFGRNLVPLLSSFI